MDCEEAEDAKPNAAETALEELYDVPETDVQEIVVESIEPSWLRSPADEKAYHPYSREDKKRIKKEKVQKYKSLVFEVED